MVKGWILDLPIILQPIVFLCIVLAAQPTLSWSLSDLDQWAHFSQYLGLCQQKLHILIVMCCKHHESRMKRIVYVRLRYMEAFKLLNEHGTKGGHARLTQPSPPGQFRWLAMMKNAKGPDRPFTMRLLYNAPCGRWPIDHGLSVVVKPCSIKGKASLTKIFIVLKNNQSPAQSRISIFMFNICLKPHFTESG